MIGQERFMSVSMRVCTTWLGLGLGLGLRLGARG